MQVKVDILEGLERKITVEIPTEVIDKEIEAGLLTARKNARIDGFRKGKVPLHIVQQRYGAGIRQDVLGCLIESSYSDAIKEAGLIPAGQPEVTVVSGFAGGEPFVYEAKLEIVPEFDVKGLDNLVVEKPVGQISESDIDEMLETLRKQTATFKESDAASAEGDRVFVDFVGKIDGQTFDGGSAENFAVLLGAKQMLPDFEAALFDKKAGEQVTVDVHFPEDYQATELAGKTAQFEIKINRVEKPELPEVDAAFMAQFGIAEGDVAALRQAIRDNMTREMETAIRYSVNQQVMQHLVDENQVMIPEGMVKQEKERMMHEQNLVRMIPDEKVREAFVNERFEASARRRVLLGLIMSKLFEEKAIQPEEARVKAQIERVASTYEDPQEVIAYYQNNRQALEQVYAQVMEDQLIDALLADATVNEVEKTFKQILQNEAA